MKLLIVLLSLIGGLIKATRSASAADCKVSLPQHSSPECLVIRNTALAQNKKTFTLKQASHGFALLDMTPAELGAVALNDPFTRYYTRAYVGLTQINSGILERYNNDTIGQEITDISEYLKMSQFFESVLEPAVGEYARRASGREAFNDEKTTWIDDRFFTQQRLAGNNPLSIKRVSIHGEEEQRCTVKTTQGKWCHFPFKYRGKVYQKCTTVSSYKPWCSTTETYKRKWGFCQAQDVAKAQEAGDCTIKTTDGEWCHFPFYYKGVKYEECTTKYHNKPWCATVERLKPYYDRRWGNCAQGKAEEKGPVGLDWNKLKETLNPDFDWETAVQATLKTDDSLEDAIKQGRIYALRYELCDDLPRSPDLTDRDPRRTMRDFLSPIALFASAKVGNENELVPVAIQMDYKPDSAVYTPGDGDNWLMAKLNVQITDIGYAQIAEHLARVHYFVEPFCVSLKRTLPPMHPLNQILKYHCRETIVPTTFGTPVLLGESGFADLLFAYGNGGALKIVQDIHPLTSWQVTDYRKNVKDRGLDDKKLLPYFPFRDDGFKILKVIEDMVKDYVNLYYKEDKDVKEDVELQAYLNEVSLDGTGQNGGIGRIRGLPASIDSKEALCEIVSRFISHVTIYHASINYVVTDYPEYIPNQPTKLYDDTRVEDGIFSVFRLPNRLTSAIQSSAFLSLGELRFDSLFDYGNELQDNDAVKLVNGYYSYLMTVVQPHMQEENEKRKKTGHLTYPYFVPRWLPNGVQT